VLTRELAEDGYSGVEVRVTPMRTEIIIRATRTQNVLGNFFSFLLWGRITLSTRTQHGITCCCYVSGEKGRRIRELTSVVQKRFKFPENGVELYAEKVNNRGLCAIAQAESLRYKLLGGLAVRRCVQLYWLFAYLVISACLPVSFASIWILMFLLNKSSLQRVGYIKMSISCLRVTIFVDAINFL